MNPHLFVYGTLLSAAGHPMGDRLRREARLIGEASIEGQLFSLGRYPGLVETAGAARACTARSTPSTAPAASFAWLDAYEGIVLGNDEQNDYGRIERPARLASGEERRRLGLHLLQHVAASSLIPGGRWSPDAK